MFPASTRQHRATQRRATRRWASFVLPGLLTLLAWDTRTIARAEELAPHEVAGQPLAAGVLRVLEGLELLGAPLPAETAGPLRTAAKKHDALALQKLLDPHVLVEVGINPESRVKVRRGPAPGRLQQAGYTPVIVKVHNASTVTKRLNVSSPQAGAVYGGTAELSMRRQDQMHLLTKKEDPGDKARFLHVEMFASPPMTAELSGLEVEYAIALIYASDAGKREATLAFDVGQGTQDLGFRGETPVLFEIAPAVPVRLTIRDFDGQPTTARLVFRDSPRGDSAGRVHPPQAKRLAPDFFFQQQIYRHDGEQVLLPPGELLLESSRGPEYRVETRPVKIAAGESAALEIKLARWVNPVQHGWYSGDHHIHGAGCAHYTTPTEGVSPADMFRQIKGEGLNVGCVLTWGPCYEFQRRFFAPNADGLSEPMTLLKYDLEISGFGSQALGHVCLLNLKDQTFPGSDGTKTKGWPTWTTPVMRWAKEQGGVTGYAHSASGLEVVPKSAAARLLAEFDKNGDRALSAEEAARRLLPEPFADSDRDQDGRLIEAELVASHERAADRLPNLAIPEMNGVGAMEVCVSTALGACDFISAMDTPRIAEWNCWYHILNTGFPLKVSGETDFPCMSSTRVGQGRVYVQLGRVEKLDFTAWCRGIAQGRSYVSDGYAHALEFRVAGQAPGYDNVALAKAGPVEVTASVTFAEETPRGVAYGDLPGGAGERLAGDTVHLHGPRSAEVRKGGQRRIELVVNGRAVASHEVPADGQPHALKFSVPIERSSWVALRQFPQLHTNPVNVLVAGQPIRASKSSARWCIAMTEQLWKARGKNIAPAERAAAEAAFQEALGKYRKIVEESAE